MRRRGITSWQEKKVEIGKSLQYQLLQEFVPEKLQKADKQNKQRFLARVNLCKSITTGIMSYSALAGITGKLYQPRLDSDTTEEENYTAVHPSLVMNQDDLTLDNNPLFTK